ncbi:homoserine kinase [Steroidobacter denitrificans]|uniref:Homoserine kinase n=1 Tax=Steroidobacter denitrificans TaxID=465721 RepID=A0A127FC00_STEDE|nr:homoserine kinase [Steroidobacter denitrificans]AMN47141.1 homoserine kinase [Steroidobacter denitrificans]
MKQSATVFAPASVGNVAVGFDVLGHSFQAIGDRVTARRTQEPGVRITAIHGVATELPTAPENNTAGMGVLSMVRELEVDFGIELSIEKGIPLGSGLGGSAASAVAAVVAMDALLPRPLSKIELLKFAMKGEQVASGTVHVDNIAPSLFGGLVLTVGVDDPYVKQIPVPPSVRCVLVHPHMMLATREARQLLKRSIDLSDVIWQSANLAGFLTGCFTDDLQLIRASLEDVIVEPQRKALIPGFQAVKDGAMAQGALGCSISGAGPTVFAWCEEPQAHGVRDAMVAGFAAHGLECDAWVSTLEPIGARVIDAT